MILSFLNWSGSGSTNNPSQLKYFSKIKLLLFENPSPPPISRK